MILVVADDLTGAAEIAGLGLNYGLNVEIVTSAADSRAEMLVIATNTRSVGRDVAYAVSSRLAIELKKMDYEWLYKKTDSVLRGHVLTELTPLLENGIRESCLLVPANPGLNRTIRDGIYYINNTPLTETDFVNDPGYRIRSSEVMELLGREKGVATRYLKPNDSIPPVEGSPGEGDQAGRLPKVCLGEASTKAHLAYWAGQVTERILPAGAAEFFEAIIAAKTEKQDRPPTTLALRARGKVLIVCGSAFKKERQAIEAARERGARVCEMPDEVFYHHPARPAAIKSWLEQISGAFKFTRCVILEINRPVLVQSGIGRRLSSAMAETVASVLDIADIDELYIEGGDTAFAILQKSGYTRFQPFEQVEHGVIRMRPAENPGLYITLKVGSYTWPAGIWNSACTNNDLPL